MIIMTTYGSCDANEKTMLKMQYRDWGETQTEIHMYHQGMYIYIAHVLQWYSSHSCMHFGVSYLGAYYLMTVIGVYYLMTVNTTCS